MHDLPTTVTSCLPFEAIDRMLDLGSGAFKVWVYFWRHADADGRIAASLSCIAAGVHMSIEAVRRSTAELETKKRICCKREGSGPRATTYELVLLESSRSGNSSNRVDQAENYSNRVDQELLESPPSSTRIEEIFGDSEPESSRARVDQDSLFKETPRKKAKKERTKCFALRRRLRRTPIRPRRPRQLCGRKEFLSFLASGNLATRRLARSSDGC